MNNSENKKDQTTLFESAMELSNKELKEKCSKLHVNTHGAIEKKDYAQLLVNAEINNEKKTSQVECSVCYENIGEKNNCITPCGHTFCFKCMMSCLNYKNTCPICRQVLQEEINDEVSEEFSEEEDGDDIEEENNWEIISDGNWGIHNAFLPGMNSQLPAIPLETMTNISTSNNYKATPRKITDKIKAHGYTLEDIIVLWTWRVDRMNPKYNQRYLEKMRDDMADLINTLDCEQSNSQYERDDMEREDKNQNQMDISQELQTLFGNENI